MITAITCALPVLVQSFPRLSKVTVVEAFSFGDVIRHGTCPHTAASRHCRVAPPTRWGIVHRQAELVELLADRIPPRRRYSRIRHWRKPFQMWTAVSARYSIQIPTPCRRYRSKYSTVSGAVEADHTTSSLFERACLEARRGEDTLGLLDAVESSIESRLRPNSASSKSISSSSSSN